jgi:hypothetical protein
LAKPDSDYETEILRATDEDLRRADLLGMEIRSVELAGEGSARQVLVRFYDSHRRVDRTHTFDIYDNDIFLGYPGLRPPPADFAQWVRDEMLDP